MDSRNDTDTKKEIWFPSHTKSSLLSCHLVTRLGGVRIEYTARE